MKAIPVLVRPGRPARCFWLAAILAAAAGCNVVPAVRAEVRFVGTDLLGIEFSRVLLRCRTQSGEGLRLALDGSRPALEELRTGKADLALVLMPDGETAGAEFAEVTVAHLRPVFLVPVDCPVQRVNLDDLAGIFGATGSRPILRWGDLGAGADWAASPVVPIAPVDGAGLVVDYVQHRLLRDRPLPANLVRYRDTADLVRRLRADSRAIALGCEIPPAASGVRALAVATAPGAPAHGPEAEPVQSGDYPLRVPLQVVIRRSARAELLPVLQFLAGDEAAEIMAKAGFLAAPTGIRLHLRTALALPEAPTLGELARR